MKREVKCGFIKHAVKKYFLVVGILVFVACAHSPERVSVQDSTLMSSLEGLLIQHHVPGASIAILQNGKLLPPVTSGLANIEKNVPVVASTLFQACSMTKTCASVWIGGFGSNVVESHRSNQ